MLIPSVCVMKMGNATTQSLTGAWYTGYIH